MQPKTKEYLFSRMFLPGIDNDVWTNFWLQSGIVKTKQNAFLLGNAVFGVGGEELKVVAEPKYTGKGLERLVRTAQSVVLTVPDRLNHVDASQVITKKSEVENYLAKRLPSRLENHRGCRLSTLVGEFKDGLIHARIDGGYYKKDDICYIAEEVSFADVPATMVEPLRNFQILTTRSYANRGLAATQDNFGNPSYDALEIYHELEEKGAALGLHPAPYQNISDLREYTLSPYDFCQTLARRQRYLDMLSLQVERADLFNDPGEELGY